MTTPSDSPDLVPFDDLSAEAFRAHEGEAFRIRFADAALDIALREVRGLKGDTRRDDRQPFSLLFRGPADAPLEQAIYRFERDGWGSMDLFLVCVGPDPDDTDHGMLYEVVFT